MLDKAATRLFMLSRRQILDQEENNNDSRGDDCAHHDDTDTTAGDLSHVNPKLLVYASLQTEHSALVEVGEPGRGVQQGFNLGRLSYCAGSL